MRKIIKWLRNLFNKSYSVVREIISPSVEVVELLKIAVESPLADVATALIPSTVDDLIKAQLRHYLPIVLQQLKIAEAVTHETDPDKIIAAAIAKLKELNPTARKTYWNSIAVMLTQYLADGKLQWCEIVHLVQFTYDEVYKNKTA